jgi:AAA ATPase domain
VVITGEPGVGKSRLLHDLSKALASQRVAWLEGRCLSYGATIPYLPILDILRTACGIAEADSTVAVDVDHREWIAWSEIFLGWGPATSTRSRRRAGISSMDWLREIGPARRATRSVARERSRGPAGSSAISSAFQGWSSGGGVRLARGDCQGLPHWSVPSRSG